MSITGGRLCRLFLTGFLCLLAASGAPNQAARSRSLGLGDMASRAGRIFVGRCTQVEVDAGGSAIPSTTYTFAVTEPVKGVGRGPVTFRVPGTPERPLFAGMPFYETGQEALLLLYPESEAGFSTAIGLDQGHFRLLGANTESARVVNGKGNRELLRDVPESILNSQGLDRDAGGPLELVRVLRLLRSLTAGRP